MNLYKDTLPSQETVNVTVNFLQGLSSPYSAESNRLSVDENGYDLPDFFKDLDNLFKSYQRKSNEFKDFSISPGSVYGTVSKDEGNHIRYNVQERTHATTSSSSKPHVGATIPRWILRDTVKDEHSPGYDVYYLQKRFDNTFYIESWSKNYRDADRGAYIIESLLDTYARFFVLKGLEELRYYGRKKDEYTEVGNYGFYRIPLLYYVRTTKTSLVHQKLLEELILDVKTTH